MNQIKVELQSVYGTDLQIAQAAWTSSTEYKNKKLRSEEDVKRVINMLADLKHSVPFESIILRFWIKMPISTDRQFQTHRLQSSSGMSARYRTMPTEFLDIPDDVEKIIDKVKYEEYLDLFEEYYHVCEQANNLYTAALTNLKKAEKDNLITNSEYKRFREFYRGILPQNNMTERVSIMNLRAFANFIKLRLTKEAQPEIRQVAELMLEAVKQMPECKLAIEALERNNWVI